MDDTLYREVILDLYTHPTHKRALPTCTHQGVARNASCGDVAEICLMVNQKGMIEQACWQGEGCAISTAAMEVFCQRCTGLAVVDLEAMTVDNILSDLGLRSITQGREKCVRLPLLAVQNIKEQV